MFLLLIIISTALSYFIFSYLFLLQMEKRVHKLQLKLFESSDNRFRMFENLLNKSLIYLDYEQTFLNEIVRLRSQATKFKQEDDLRAAFFYEEKISHLAEKINIFFSEFPILNKIEDADKIQKEILEMEQNLLNIKNKYNSMVINYNKIRSLPIFTPIINLFYRFERQVEPWKITS